MERRNHLYCSSELLLTGGLLAYGLSELLVALGLIVDYQFKEFSPLSDLLDTTVNQSYEMLSMPLWTANDTTTTELRPADSISSKGVTTDTLAPLELSSRLVDYSKGQSALHRLHAALREGRSRSIRIAFVGDSFIEGDILVAPSYQALQQRYGGKGVGCIPLISTAARLRQSIQQRFKGAWRQTLASKSNSQVFFTPSGTLVTATASVSTSYRLTNANRATLHYIGGAVLVAITYGINGGEYQHAELPANHGALTKYAFPHDAVKQFELATGNGDGTRFYGVCFNDMTGTSVNSYSPRNPSGTKLTAVSSALMLQLPRFRPHDLIILSYGLNILNPEGNNDSYEWYYDVMAKSTEHIQQLYPHVTTLLMFPFDRATLHKGEIHSLSRAARVLRIQCRLTQRYGLLSWNTRETMVSFSDIEGFVDKGWAAKDYTYISMAGGTQLVKLSIADLIGDESG